MDEHDYAAIHGPTVGDHLHLGDTGLVVKVGEATLKYGKFLQTCLDFLIIAWAVFLMIKLMNRLKREEPAAPAAPAEPSEEVKLLREIRDALAKR